MGLDLFHILLIGGRNNQGGGRGNKKNKDILKEFRNNKISYSV